MEEEENSQVNMIITGSVLVGTLVACSMTTTVVTVLMIWVMRM